MLDCHVHSFFSADSDMDAVVACETAIERGLEGLIFTDHLDIDFPSADLCFNMDFEAYSEYMDRLKREYSPKLKVLKGIEVGIMPHVIEESSRIVNSYDFDYVLGSIHIIDGLDPYLPEYYRGKTKAQCYCGYLEKIIFMLDSFSDFDVVAHYDFIIRKACYEDRSFRYDEFSEIFDELLRKIMEKGKGLEINTGSYRDIPENAPVPRFDFEILKRYRQLGGEIITIGSDAHNKSFIGHRFEYFKARLKEAGFSHVAHYEKRRPVFDRL